MHLCSSGQDSPTMSRTVPTQLSLWRGGCPGSGTPLRRGSPVLTGPWDRTGGEGGFQSVCAVPPEPAPSLLLAALSFPLPKPASAGAAATACLSAAAPLPAPCATVLPCALCCSLRTCCATAVCLLCCSQAGLYYCARCWCRAPVVTQHPIGGANELRRQRKKL